MRFEQIIHWMKQLNGKTNSALYAPLLRQNNAEHLAFLRNLEKEMERENTLFTPLEKLKVVVFDLETTGFSPDKGDQILSMGAIKVNGVEVIPDQTFYSLVHYEGILSTEVQQLTGMIDENLKNAPALVDVLLRFYQFTKGTTLVAHHASHEKSFLQQANWKLFKTPFKQRIVDTAFLIKLVETKSELFHLEDCCSYYGINIHERHHALGDAKMTAQLWVRLVKKLKELGCQTLFDVYERYRK
ncbi:DNA polymerase III subunit epsilon [Bacillaceae bacterium SAOS 7]|nr:DNA polymerase III subunit epsilon [Bacillaceae bacterium SAOS 7]